MHLNLSKPLWDFFFGGWDPIVGSPAHFAAPKEVTPFLILVSVIVSLFFLHLFLYKVYVVCLLGVAVDGHEGRRISLLWYVVLFCGSYDCVVIFNLIVDGVHYHFLMVLIGCEYLIMDKSSVSWLSVLNDPNVTVWISRYTCLSNFYF